MSRLGTRSHAVAVRQYDYMEWAWEVVDPHGATIAEGRAWSYSDALTRARNAERGALELSPARR